MKRPSGAQGQAARVDRAPARVNSACLWSTTSRHPRAAGADARQDGRWRSTRQARWTRRAPCRRRTTSSCLTDMRLPDGEGWSLVRHIASLGGATRRWPSSPPTGSAEDAVAALKAGAFDCVSKPVGLGQLRAGEVRAVAAGARRRGGGRPAVARRARRCGKCALTAKLARTQAPVCAHRRVTAAARSSRALSPGRRAAISVRAGQLRRHRRVAHGKRTVRLRKGAFTGRRRTATPFPGRARRHAVSR
jgi:CheY-like chemotaxis protein